MKKALALFLGTMMVGTVVTGLVGCKKDDGIADFKRLADPRDQGAFEVYSPEGDKIGAYPSIARAINAAVENDLDAFENTNVSPTARGSYVTKKGSTRKIFENMVKYSADAAADNYWYYEDNSLAGFEYWTTGAPYTRAQNAKHITYTTHEGTVSGATNSGYGLLDGLGQPIDPGTYNLQSFSWELIPMTDANIKGVPVRERGATGARYELDLSDVKIKPAYEGVEDEVYAFFGYTIGAGDYSLDIGLACNVNTGVWKEYISENPNNNVGGEGKMPHVTVEYDIGDTIFTSTWNKEGGYFSPNVKSVTLEVKEFKDEDEEGFPWWYDRIDITLENETKPAVTEIVDDNFLTDHGNAGVSFDRKNGFYFSAGLDIVAKGAEVGDDVAATDYTIGATFENLVISDAGIYFPTEEEISNTDYGASIDPLLRGDYHSIRTPYEGRTSGVYNYTILALNACIDYEMVNGMDTYSFRYDKYEVPANAFTGGLKTYQDKIDALSSITKETAGSYKAAFDEIIEWLGPDGDVIDGKVGNFATGKNIPSYYYPVLDWQPLFDAYKTYLSAITLTEEGTQFLNDFNELTAINNVAVWKGWKAPDGATGEAEMGYLYNELQIFKGLAARYTSLSADDKFGIELLVGDLWWAWTELNDDYDAMLATGDKFATKSFTIPTLNTDGTVTMTGTELVDEFFKLAYEAYLVTKDETHTQHGGALCVEISNDPSSKLVNQHFFKNFRMFYLEWFFNQQEVTIGYCNDIIVMLQDYCLGTGAGSYNDFHYIAAVSVQLERILTGECYYLDEELAEMINNHMVGFAWENGTWDWAFSAGGGDLNDRGYNWKSYFGENIAASGKTFRNLIHEYLKPILLRDSDATIPDYVRAQGTFPGMAVSKKVSAIKIELGEKGAAWENEWKRLKDISKLDGWKGWKSEDTSDLNYVYNSLTTALGLIGEYNGLPEQDKNLLNIFYADSMAIWKQLSTEYEALKTNPKMVEIWDSLYDSATDTKVVEVFEAFIDHVFTHNTNGCKNGQGYLCMEDQACGRNSVYVLYLNKKLEESGITMGYWKTVVDLLKNQGESGRSYTGLSAGAGSFIDYNYIYYMGKQIGRIIRGEVDYLDAELAETINTYMVANHSNSSTGYGTNSCFYNGTWCWVYYGINNPSYGYITGYSVNWMKAIDIELDGVTNSRNWGAAIKYVTDILDAAGYGKLLVGAGASHQAPAMVISEEVKAQLGINDLDNIEATVDAVVAIFNAMEFHDITNPQAWTGGTSVKGTSKGYVYDEVKMFAKIYNVYKNFDAGKQAAVKAQTENFQAWIDLLNAYNALSTEKNISIVNAELDGFVKTSQLDLVNEFFNIVFKTYDTTIAHNTPKNKFGFLCFQHENCFKLSMRALYLNKMIELNIADFDYTADLLDAMAKLESTGNSKYTGVTETQNALYDFEYLWNMSIQINRILSGKCTYLDVELAEAINKYMYGDKTAGLGGDANYRCAGSFYHMSLSYMYRNYNGHIGQMNGDQTWKVTGWEMYFGLPESDGDWGVLIKKVADIIVADSRYTEAILVPAEGKQPMLINDKVEAAQPDLSGITATVEGIQQAYAALGLSNLTNMSPEVWKGGKSTEGGQKGYLYDEVVMFGKVYLAYLTLSKDDQGAVDSALAELGFPEWTALYLAYDALSTVKNISVPNEALTGYTTMSAFEVVNEFINNLAKSYDEDAANHPAGSTNSKAFGYLCFEDATHFKASMRALYLYKMIEVNKVDFEFAELILTQATAYGNGETDAANLYSRYTGYTEAENSALDFEYLWNMSAQILRIRNEKLRGIDAELVEAINTYMYQDPESLVGDASRTNHRHCYNSFYNMSLSNWYRKNNIGEIGNTNNGTVTGWGLYFGFTANENNWATLIGTVTDLIKKFYDADKVLQKTGKLADGPNEMLTRARVEEKAAPTVSPAAEAIIEAFTGLNELDKLSSWKGWTGDEAGYVAYELGIFNNLLKEFNKLDDTQKELVEVLVDANKWALWNTLATEYAALAKIQDSIAIFDTAFAEQTTSKTKAELLAMFVDGAFWFKRSGHTSSCVSAAQGYLGHDDATCAQNSIYTMYLYEVLVENNVNIAYRTTVINLLKNQGQDFVSDYDYVWHVGKQIARIIKTELNYIDEELAAVVNKYMVVSSSSKKNFNNGTWSYMYGAGASGYIEPKIGNKNWLKAIDEEIYKVVGGYSGWGGSNWSLAMAYLTGTNGLLTKAGYSGSYNKAVEASNALFLTETVAVQKDPDALESVEDIKELYDTLHNLTDLTPGTWRGGASDTSGQKAYQARFIYDEAMIFDKIEKSATKLNKVDEVKALIGAENYNTWADLVAKYKALGTTTDYQIVNSTLADNTVAVSALSIVNGCLNAAFGSHDDTFSSNSQKTRHGYLCMNDQDHFLLSIRALYLRKLVQEHKIDFPFIDKLFENMGNYVHVVNNSAGEPEGKLTSRYTGLSDTAGAIIDFDYLWNIGKQIKRIIDLGGVDKACMDEEMATAINSYMVAKGTGDHPKEAGYYGTLETFYNIALSTRYRDPDGIYGFKLGWDTNWLRYLDLHKAGMSWNDLLKNYLNKVIARDKTEDVQFIAPRDNSTNTTPMVINKAVTAVTGPGSSNPGTQE